MAIQILRVVVVWVMVVRGSKVGGDRIKVELLIARVLPICRTQPKLHGKPEGGDVDESINPCVRRPR